MPYGMSSAIPFMNTGSGSTAYWSATATTPHDQDSFKDGWNLIAFNWNGATETGTVDPTAIDYLRVTITYDGTADTDIMVDKISASTGEIWETEYYSKYLFRNAAGTWINKPTADTDIVNLDEDSYNILLFILSYLVTQKIQVEDGVFDRNFFDDELTKAVKEYKSNYRSEAIRPQSNYYRPLGRTRRRGSSNNRR